MCTRGSLVRLLAEELGERFELRIRQLDFDKLEELLEFICRDNSLVVLNELECVVEVHSGVRERTDNALDDEVNIYVLLRRIYQRLQLLFRYPLHFLFRGVRREELLIVDHRCLILQDELTLEGKKKSQVREERDMTAYSEVNKEILGNVR